MTAGDGKLGVRGRRVARWVVWSVEMREKEGRKGGRGEGKGTVDVFYLHFFDEGRDTWEECRWIGHDERG